MIDAREDVSAPAPKAASRRNNKVSAARSMKQAKSETKKSLRIERVFSDAKVKPFDQIEWDKRTAEITDDAGKVIFKQENVEVPKSWSVLATKVVVSKYFYGEQHTSERETSVRQLIHRVMPHDRRLGHRGRLFQQGGRRNFLRGADLAVRQPIRRVQFAGLVQRRALPPIRRRQKFRQGQLVLTTARPGEAERATTQYEYPQGSACFIQSVDDNMECIMHLAYSEAMLFKYGSGTGTDLDADPFQPRETERRRPAQRPAVLPQGL